VYLRPYQNRFLKNLSQVYEIFIFTASNHEYAQKIIDLLDPKCEFIDGIIDRRYCLKMKNKFQVKDLRIIKNREL